MIGLALFEIIMVVVVVAILIAVFAGNRPRPERFMAVNGLDPRPDDLDHVRMVLRRTWVSRLAGGVVGFAFGGVTGATLGGAGAIAGAGIGLLAGTMLGITIAQPRRTPASSTRIASLTVRDARNYLPRRARMATFGLACVVAGYGIFAIASAEYALTRTTTATFVLGFTTLIALSVGEAFKRRTVELRRPDGDAESVCVDDALRASALRGIHHATIGVLMCGLLLVGYGAVTTQNVATVQVGDRVVLRMPSDGFIQMEPDRLLSLHPRRYRVEWTQPGGVKHSRLIRTGGARITLNSLDVGPLLGIGYWVVVFGFFGALIEWSRAAKAWRRPQTTPSAVEVAV